MEERLHVELSSVRLVFLRNFAFYNFLLESQFLVLRRGLSNFAAAVNITQYHYIIKALQKKCSQGYLQRNFALYKFSQNLGFQLLEKDLTTLQILRILHGIIIISQFVRRTTTRAIFRKFRILRNFVFYNFCQNLGIQH